MFRGFTRADYAGSAGMLAYSTSSVVTPVCLVMIAADLDLSLAEGGLMEVSRTGLMLVVLLLSGFAAARWGKAPALGAGALLMGSGMLLYAAAPGYGAVLVAMGLAGFGGGVLEGLLNPFVHDAHPGDSGRYLNITNGFWSVGVLGASVLVGHLLLAGVSWRWVMGGTGVFALGVSALLFSCHDRDGSHVPAPVAETLGHARAILARKQFWLFAVAMFFAGGVEGAYTFWTSAMLQLRHGADARVGGIGLALFASGMVIGRFLAGHYVPQHRLRTLILVSCVAGGVASLLPAAAGSVPVLYAILFAAGLSIACFWPSLQSYASDCMPVDSSMLFILLSCAGIPGFGMVVWLMGVVSGRFGFDTAFRLLPLPFLVVASAVLLVGVRNRDEPGAA